MYVCAAKESARMYVCAAKASALCDSGYHQWAQTVCGFKHASSKQHMEWSARCESARKQVECVFGSMKKRFRILRLPMLYNKAHPISKIDHIFRTCCIFHNLLMAHNDYNTIGDRPEDYVEVETEEHEARSQITSILDGTTVWAGNCAWVVHAGTDCSRVGSQCLHPDAGPDPLTGSMSPVIVEVEAGFSERRKRLVTHFNECQRLGGGGQHGEIHDDKVRWLETAKVCRPTAPTYRTS